MKNNIFLEGVQISILAMLIVFVLLYLISLVLSILPKILNSRIVQVLFIGESEIKIIPEKITPEKEVFTNPTSQAISYNELEADEELKLAAIIATIDMAGDKDISNYRVIKAKRV